MSDATDTERQPPAWACTCGNKGGARGVLEPPSPAQVDPECPVHSPNLELRICQQREGCTASFTHTQDCPALAHRRDTTIEPEGGEVVARTMAGEEIHWPERPLPEDTERPGVWACFKMVAGVHVPGEVYPTEVEALRAALRFTGYSGVLAWPYGVPWHEVVAHHRAQLLQPVNEMRFVGFHDHGPEVPCHPGCPETSV